MSCENCTRGSYLPGEPMGTILPSGAYLASPSSNLNGDSRAIILFTDVFGLALKNSKIIADTLSTRLSCPVYVPDIFAGDPLFPLEGMHELLPDRAGVSMGVWGRLRFFWGVLPRAWSFWKNRPGVVDPRTLEFIKKVRTERGFTNVGGVGYCFGASLATRLASSGVLDSVVICHPGPLSDTQVKAINIPNSWVLAEEDVYNSAAARDHYEALIAARKGKENAVEYEFVDYKGTAHGFAVRPNLTYPDVKAGFEGALEQTVNWFQKTLPVQQA